ncbi:MAG: sulfite exporter TauE/SafE family protein [Flavobacteriales bacterium]|nr:sulfite exporter TauE/SafE family protein [Flavobacteriales bacterium]
MVTFKEKTMDSQTILILVVIGILAGVLSGFVGVGGGVIIVPALIYVLGMSQFDAQGTSLFVLLLPVGILAVYNYYKTDQINWKFGLIISIAFVVGGFFGSKLALKLSPSVVRIIFGAIMAIVSIKMITSGINTLSNDS